MLCLQKPFFCKFNSTCRLRCLSAKLVSAKQIARIYFLLNIVQTAIVAVGNNGLTALLEFRQIIHDFTAKEGRTILQRRLIDDDRCALCLDTLHDALNGGLTEVVRVGFHGQAVYANHNIVFLAGIVVLVGLTLRNSLGAFRHKQTSTLVAEQTTISSIYRFLRVNI